MLLSVRFIRLQSFLASCAMLFAVCLTGTHAAEPNKSKLGISADRPADGPSVKVEGGYMVPYTVNVPGSDVKIEMVPVPGGKFKFGSSEDSDGHVEDEGPQIELEVAPMWVAKFETTWHEYKYYMSMYEVFKDLQDKGVRMISDENKSDAVTTPTPLYDPTFTYEYGQDLRLPAVTMTQYSAKQYTKWLSKLTSQQFRLPTEAEWEYACRAGSETEYYFGDDEDELEDYAWFYDNSDEVPHLVGEKKPNAFGLYDMHGNVMEWVIDGYTEDGYEAAADKEPKTVMEAIQWAETPDNRVVRGGSFQDDPEMLRSAARRGSEDEDWKEEDPNIPLSPFWYSNDPARGVGFRIVRSFQPLDNEMIKKFWEVDNEDIEFDVQERVMNGKASAVAVDAELGQELGSGK